MWCHELDRLGDDLCALLGTAELLSARYFSGEELIYPDELTILAQMGELLEGLRTTDLLTFLSPAERKRLFAPLKGGDDEWEDNGEDAACPPSPAARSLARELVVLARAEALTQLGERDRGVDMVAAWMRSGTA